MRKPKLSEEDKQRVSDYLENNPLHRDKERKPLRAWHLFLLLAVFVSILGFGSIMLGKYYFYV